jgi:fucose permease
MVFAENVGHTGRAYFLSPILFAGDCLKRFGFKATFMTGLTICGCGCLVFWPSAVLQSYTGFCISMFIVGAGLATIEVGANIFMVLCGPPEYSEIRLNLAQSVQPVGSLLSSLIAGRVLPDVEHRSKNTSLADVQWIYLAFGLFAFLLAFSIHYVDVPEVKFVPPVATCTPGFP